jgi:multidrug resistance efflux pump
MVPLRGPSKAPEKPPIFLETGEVSLDDLTDVARLDPQTARALSSLFTAPPAERRTLTDGRAPIPQLLTADLTAEPPAPPEPPRQPEIDLPMRQSITMPPPPSVATPLPAVVEAPEQPEEFQEDPQQQIQDAIESAESSPEAAKRRRARWLLTTGLRLAIVGALLAAGYFVHYPLRITHPCRVNPLELVRHRSPMSGVIEDIPFDEGQKVKEGDVILKLAGRDLEVEAQKSKAKLEKELAELERLKKGAREEEIARAKSRIASLSKEAGLATATAQRIRKLEKDGVASVQERERAMQDLAAKEGELSQARADLKVLLAGSVPAEIAKKEAEIRAIKAELDFTQQQIERTLVRADSDGVVITRKPRDRLRDHVEQGEIVLEIARMDVMRVEVMVEERDFDVLAVGAPLRLKVAAYPTTSFQGKVARVAQQAQPFEDRNVIVAEAEVTNPDLLLRPNMTGWAEIDGEDRPVLWLLVRRIVRWVRIRFLI